METKVRTEYPPLILHLGQALEMDEKQFFQFCRINDELRIERTAEADLEIMPSARWETGGRSALLTAQVVNWSVRNATGIATDSSVGFILPNGAMRAPDVAWVRRERLAKLSAEQKAQFLPLCPDFVVELRSPSDRLENLQHKMREYLENGARLGWSVDPEGRRVYAYEPDKGVRVLENPDEIPGDPVLPGFVLDLRQIWTPGF